MPNPIEHLLKQFDWNPEQLAKDLWNRYHSIMPGLKWEDASPIMRETFIKSVTSLITDPLKVLGESIKFKLSEWNTGDKFLTTVLPEKLEFNFRQCYYCNLKFKPRTEQAYRCDKCSGLER